MTYKNDSPNEGASQTLPLFDDFLSWEKASKDTIDFKKIYVDMTGDLISGLLLSQIIYWYLPDKNGKSKLRVFKAGNYWIAKQLPEWWEEVRITPKQVRRSLGILADLGIIEKRNFRFNGLRTNHIRILPDGFMAAWQKALKGTTESDEKGLPVVPKGNDRKLPKVTTESDERARLITENTNPENTEKTTTKEREAAASGSLSTSGSSSFGSQVEQAINLYQEETGKKLGRVQKGAIADFVEHLHGGFDLDLWGETITNVIMGGCKPGNLEALINTYWWGNGDYGEWMSIRKGSEGGQNERLLRMWGNKPHWKDFPVPLLNKTIYWKSHQNGSDNSFRVPDETIRITTTHGVVHLSEFDDPDISDQVYQAIEDHYQEQGLECEIVGQLDV